MVGWLLRARLAALLWLCHGRRRGWVRVSGAGSPSSSLRERERKEAVVGREEGSEFGVAGGPRGSTEEGEWRKKKKIHSVPPTTNCRQKYNRGGDFEVGSAGRASRKERERKDLEILAI